MAARSHSMSSTKSQTVSSHVGRLAFVEIALIEVIWLRNIHVIETRYLKSQFRISQEPDTNITMGYRS
jgi:hypothetical protein